MWYVHGSHFHLRQQRCPVWGDVWKKIRESREKRPHGLKMTGNLHHGLEKFIYYIYNIVDVMLLISIYIYIYINMCIYIYIHMNRDDLSNRPTGAPENFPSSGLFLRSEI